MINIGFVCTFLGFETCTQFLKRVHTPGGARVVEHKLRRTCFNRRAWIADHEQGSYDA
jgi:hypothetical protein